MDASSLTPAFVSGVVAGFGTGFSFAWYLCRRTDPAQTIEGSCAIPKSRAPVVGLVEYTAVERDGKVLSFHCRYFSEGRCLFAHMNPCTVLKGRKTSPQLRPKPRPQKNPKTTP